MTDSIRVALINPQGHVRWNNPPIAGHPDTGGQIVYILELAKELALLGCKVDIFTRYFDDKDWPGYAERIENHPKLENLRIVRITCGPEDKFLNKEKLWPHIREYADGISAFYRENEIKPDVVTSHYADGGLTAAILKKDLEVPFTHTGHSLGGQKIDNLEVTEKDFEEINSRFEFGKRISAERITFRNAHAIVTSTREEIEKQYGNKTYSGAVDNQEKFRIIPPGIDPSHFYSFREEEEDAEAYNSAVEKLKAEMKKNIDSDRADLPFVFSAARFDAKKNPAGLMRAYASSKLLREKTNLMIIAGSVGNPLKEENRSKFNKNEQKIIDELKEIIEENSLEGSVVFSPGFDFATEMPCVYRYAGRNGWTFVNPALHEPFGLTIVEAMASGLPVVATMHGGPSEILDGGKYGVLADSTSTDSLREGMEKLIEEGDWEKFSKDGVRRVLERFTWGSAAKGYLKLFKEISKQGADFKNDYEIPEWFLNPSTSDESSIDEELKNLYFI